jgi:small GTP-binding protein
MIQKKICMLGAFAVGKTSMVSRLLDNTFSDKYLTTAGVKIGKKTLSAKGQDVSLILWDLAGEDEFQQVQTSYFRGSAGYLLVIDGTRRDTLDTALSLNDRIQSVIGRVPFVAVLNKVDLAADWEVQDGDIESLKSRDWVIIKASAKTGEGVAQTFVELAERMI